MGKGSGITIELRRTDGEPVFLSLAASILAEIERGRLRPGDALPGTRALARSLRLNRNTVDAAYHELTMQGWLAAEPSRGTFVAHDLPDLGKIALMRRQRPPKTAQEAGAAPRPMLDLSDGAPDPRLLPVAEFARAFRHALAGPALRAAGSYGDPRGCPVLRHELASYLRQERGVTAAADDILVARGSQMALFLAASAVVEPGEIIAVETPGYPLAWAAFRAAGARIAGVPVDGGGIDIDRLESLAAREARLKAVYLTPHHQYPTTVTLGAARRLKLLDLARRHGLTIIEDDYDHEYRFDGRPLLPLSARAEADSQMIYVGSLSKLLAPGIRIGYAVAGRAHLQRMTDRREAIDRQGDLPLEHALAGLIASGTLRRHARKARRIYQARRDLLAALLRERLAGEAEFALPAGGLAIWLRLKQGVSAERTSAETWAANAAAIGLSVQPGVRFALDTAHPPEAFRLGFAGLDDTELRRAADLLAKARPPSSGDTYSPTRAPAAPRR